MKIVHFTSGTVPVHSDVGGGVERHIRAVTKELSRSNHDVTIVDNDYVDNPETFDNVAVKRLSTPHVSTGLFDGWADTVANETLFASRLGRAAPTVRDADVVHAHNAYVGTRVRRLAKRNGTSFVYTCHNGMWCTDDVNKYERHVVRRLEGRLLADADIGIAVSDAVAEGVEAFNGKKPEVIPNGVDVNEFRPDLDTTGVLDEYGLRDSRVVLFVGRISRAKGIDTLIESINKFPDSVSDNVKFVLVGPDVQMFGSNTRSEFSDYVADLVESEGVRDQLVFTGQVPEEDLHALYAAADVFTLPSRFEAQPMVVVEALASGTPIVASTAGGIPEVVTDDVGSIVPIGDSDRLAQAISEILRLDETEYQDLSEAARELAMNEYSWDVITNHLLERYQRLID